MAAVNVVVSCTDRKTLAPIPQLQLRNTLARGPLATRWLGALKRAKAPKRKAAELYCGEMWSTAMQLRSARRGTQVSMWVASAGYGLIPADAPIHSYGATFAAGHPDSIHREESATAERSRDWWRAVTKWEGPLPGVPRTVAAVAASAPDTPIVVAAGPAYLRAICSDLQEAAASLEEPSLLTVVTSKLSTLPGLEGNIVRTNSRLSSALGGTMISLNTRVALHAIRQNRPHELRAEKLRPYFDQLAEQGKDPMATNRDRQGDDEVRQFIRLRLRENPKAKHSPLLRAFRETGLACEQSRFKQLFLEVKGETDAS